MGSTPLARPPSLNTTSIMKYPAIWVLPARRDCFIGICGVRDVVEPEELRFSVAASLNASLDQYPDIEDAVRHNEVSEPNQSYYNRQ